MDNLSSPASFRFPKDKFDKFFVLQINSCHRRFSSFYALKCSTYVAKETHEKYFYGTEHWNYFTNDEVICFLKYIIAVWV